MRPMQCYSGISKNLVLDNAYAIGISSPSSAKERVCSPWNTLPR